MATSVGAATGAVLLAGVGAASGAAAALWAGSSGGVGSCSGRSGGACCSSGGLGSAISPGRGRRDDEPRVRFGRRSGPSSASPGREAWQQPEQARNMPLRGYTIIMRVRGMQRGNNTLNLPGTRWVRVGPLQRTLPPS